MGSEMCIRDSLSDIALEKPEVLHKLLSKKKLNSEEEASVRSIEFSVTIKRLDTLIKKKLLKNYSDLAFISEHKDTLTKLNNIRNRIWHRGVYVLRYSALDKFISGYVLPFVIEAIKHPSLASQQDAWRFKNLHADIDPISELVKEIKSTKPDIGKLALLKELGRSGYENPLKKSAHVSGSLNSILMFFDKKHIERAERIAKVEASQEHSSITKCPVCGVKSLIIYKEIEHDFVEGSSDFAESWMYTTMVKCECCSFNLEGGIKNASEYGLTELEDYWV